MGAGKTCLVGSVLRLDAHSRAVTNDQAPHSVDTAILSSVNDAIGEVSGSCFRCDFHALTSQVALLHAHAQVDYVVAEAVGSCVDIVATVLRPMREFHGGEIGVAPLTVVVDPQRLERVLFNPRRSRLHGSAAYIYAKQLEEADIILLNKVDTIDGETRTRLAARLRAEYPQARVMCASARTGDGVAEWLSVVTRVEHDSSRPTMELDYGRYAEGEAVLGWLNATARLDAGTPRRWDAWLGGTMNAIVSAVRAEGAEVGHVKALVQTGDDYVVANWVAVDGPVASAGSVPIGATAELILNARVQIAPAVLEAIVRRALDSDGSVAVRIEEFRSFSPARPVPTYRMTS